MSAGRLVRKKMCPETPVHACLSVCEFPQDWLLHLCCKPLVAWNALFPAPPMCVVSVCRNTPRVSFLPVGWPVSLCSVCVSQSLAKSRSVRLEDTTHVPVKVCLSHVLFRELGARAGTVCCACQIKGQFLTKKWMPKSWVDFRQNDPNQQ